MTDREKAIVMAYTGCTMLAGDKLGIYYEYVQEKLGRSVITHELAYQEVQDAIAEAAKEDFIAIAKADNGWISVQDRLPEDNRFVLVCNDDGHMMVAQYVGEGPIWEWQYKYTNYDVDAWDDQEQGPVCWWMPLPDAPKEG